jgi:glycolate oxidase FAD binding subunit
VRAACAARTPLVIRGGGSKDFYGNPCKGEPLDVTSCRGVVSYDPSELVITVAAGTPLMEVEQTLAAAHQYLAFEPPVHNEHATIGGAIATGLSGPRRPWTGPARDFVLGVDCINGRGERLKFGGQVIKNVAGYDVSRLLTGSLGTLGVILDVSLKVLPQAETEISLIADMPLDRARKFIQDWSGRPVPISGACYYQGNLRIRLSGYESAVMHTATVMGLTPEENTSFWQQLRHQSLDLFTTGGPLWRISLPVTATAPEDFQLMDWGGALYWSKTDMPAERLRDRVKSLGGHATLYRDNGLNVPRFQPLDNGLLALHQRLKAALDPSGILNRGRMYSEF